MLRQITRTCTLIPSPEYNILILQFFRHFLSANASSCGVSPLCSAWVLMLSVCCWRPNGWLADHCPVCECDLWFKFILQVGLTFGLTSTLQTPRTPHELCSVCNHPWWGHTSVVSSDGIPETNRGKGGNRNTFCGGYYSVSRHTFKA